MRITNMERKRVRESFQRERRFETRNEGFRERRASRPFPSRPIPRKRFEEDKDIRPRRIDRERGIEKPVRKSNINNRRPVRFEGIGTRTGVRRRTPRR